MAFDYQHQRKPILYADLFKIHKNTVPETEQRYNTVEFRSSSSSTSIQSSFCDSSSSGFSTPFDSESEDGDYISELTRRVAECMLHGEEEEEEEEEVAEIEDNVIPNCVADNPKAISGAVIKNYNNKFKYEGSHHNPISTDDQTQTLQVYKLKNQPTVSKQSPPVSHGRRLKGTESSQQKGLHKTEQQYICHGGKGQIGSGMQAVFLGGSGSRNRVSGTGVFLPRTNTNPNERKKKSGCSTVLIPTRVLQALELHFNGGLDSPISSLIGGRRGSLHKCYKDESTQYSQVQIQSTKHEDEMQLPQEWTY